MAAPSPCEPPVHDYLPIEKISLVAELRKFAAGKVAGSLQEPILDRHAKPLLASIHDFVWNQPPHCLLQNMLRSPAPHRDRLLGNAHRQLDKFVVEKRNPGLSRWRPCPSYPAA